MAALIRTGPPERILEDVRSATKTVTVLMTDLVGSTAMAQQLGRTRALETSAQHLNALRDALAVHSGVEVKSMGDGLMAVFDSTVNAIGCAVTMQRAVGRHNERFPSRRLSVRIGISIGEAAPVGDDWYGPPVIEAARLCAACPGGEAYLSDLARGVAAGDTMQRVSPVGPLELKGMREPVMTWSVDVDHEESFALRVALADDSNVLRQGVALALRSAGMDVVFEAAEPLALEQSLRAVDPHVVVLDVRMPPTFTTEGLDLAERIREDRPDIGVLVLSASVEPAQARRLLAYGTTGVGYLLKDRITDMDELTSAIRTIASGGSAIDPDVLVLMREEASYLSQPRR